MESPCQQHAQEINEHGLAIARLQEGEKFRDATLTEIKNDVKSIKEYLEQKKGEARGVALVAGVLGSIITFLGQFIFSGFITKTH